MHTTHFLILLVGLTLNAIAMESDTPDVDSSFVDNLPSIDDSEQSCIPQLSLDIVQEEMRLLKLSNVELVKTVDEVLDQLNTHKKKFEIAEQQWREKSELALEEAMAAKEAQLQETRDQLAQATQEIEAAGAAQLASNERDIETQLELSGYRQEVTDLQNTLSASQQQAERVAPLLEELREELRAGREESREALQAMKDACKAQLENSLCDFSRCWRSLIQFSGLQGLFSESDAKTGVVTQMVDFFKEHMSTGWAAVSAFCSLYWRHATLLYTRHLEPHVDELMQTDSVLQFLEYIDFLEGKTHVFLYFVWKDTPHVINKVIREVQYLGYFLHWKGRVAVSSLAVMAQRGFASAGVRGVSISALESVLYYLGTLFLLLLIYSLRYKIWTSIKWTFLCPYWIITKPFRVIYGLFFS